MVDLATGRGLLGQVPGRTSRCVVDWLADRSEQWWAGGQFVALDPSAPYAAAVRHALPPATVVVDHFHHGAAGQPDGHEGAATHHPADGGSPRPVQRRWCSDRVWANRRLLLRGRQRRSDRALARMGDGVVAHDPSGELLAAWIAKEELRGLLGCAARGGNHGDIARHQHRLVSWCASVDVPEVTTLAETIDRWWPAVLAFLRTGTTNAGTEGVNRLVTQVLCSACGFRNTGHYRDRVRLHGGRQASARATLPGVR